MAQRKLWFNYCRRALILLLLSCGLTACAQPQVTTPFGLTLQFMNKGTTYLVVKRFDLDGQRGPSPGALGASLTEGKQMTFMPADSNRGMPQFVEVEWIVPNKEYMAWSVENEKLPVTARYSKENQETYQHLWLANPHFTHRLDLAIVLTPELLAQVRTNRRNTNLQLTVTFKDDRVSVEASPEVWRK